jgi:phage gp36-like protein
MATYTDITTFEQTFPEKSIERTFVAEAASIAYEYINSALDGVYVVPFTPTPSVIEKLSNLLTRSIVLALVSKGTVTIKDIKDRSAIDPIQWLQDLRARKLSIPGVTVLAASGAWCNTAGQMHIFDLDNEVYHQPDHDRLDELANDRWSY